MKFFKGLVLFVVILCALAGAGWGGYWLYRRYVPPGGQGRNMEVRLLALNGAVPSSGIGPGVDVFQKDDVSSYIANGDAPNGWKRLPVANGVEAEEPGAPWPDPKVHTSRGPATDNCFCWRLTRPI
jgi:hypothetical protein